MISIFPHIQISWWRRLLALVRAQGSWTGFENRTETTISFDEGTRTFTIAPASPLTQFSYWCLGRRIVKFSSENIIITDSEGVHFIYYDGAILVDDPFPPDNNVLRDVTFIALIHWDATNKKATIFGDERHGLMDWWTHNMHHFSEGAVHVAGGRMLNFTLGGTGGLDSDAQIGIEDWAIDDEDIRHVCHNISSPVNPYEQILNPILNSCALYRSGSGGLWRRDDPTAFPLKMGSVYPVYNLNTAGVWTTPDVTINKYFIYWVVATNHILPTIVVPGQNEYVNIADAQNDLVWENMDLGGFATPETNLFFGLIFQAKSVANSVNATLEYIADYRGQNLKNLNISTFL